MVQPDQQLGLRHDLGMSFAAATAATTQRGKSHRPLHLRAFAVGHLM